LELHDKLTGVPYQLYYVGCLIDDDAFPGHVIVGDGSALMLLDPDRAMDNIAGVYNWFQCCAITLSLFGHMTYLFDRPPKTEPGGKKGTSVYAWSSY